MEYRSFSVAFFLFLAFQLTASLLLFKQLEESDYKYEIKTIELPVDHFSFAVNNTFKLRYLVNDTWQRAQDSPIFFYTGNEGSIELFAKNSGFMWDIAIEFGAVLIFAEHRYYGESQPFGNRSFSDPKYLGYLTSQQALADYVDLIRYLRSDPRKRESPVIAFGGSYGGMLSAWIRMKYPHIVQGAIAASAPILYFPEVVSCGAFLKIVTSDFGAANSACPKLIRKSWSEITSLGSTAEGRKWLTENWKLCEPLNNTTQVEGLKSWLNDVYGNLAMVNYPYESNFLMPLPAYPVSAVCEHLTNLTLTGKPLLESLYRSINTYANYTGKATCLSTDESAENLDSHGWEYQSCTEMVMPTCSDGENDMFEPNKWDFKKFSDDCYATYKVRPQSYLACQEYGCDSLWTATNIVFSNGLLDPWTSGGVLRNVSSSAIAVIIPEGAHHLDLRGRNPNDPYSVIQARKFHRYSIRKWIRQHRENQGTS
ncbi:lysosomal Pro-X carboxypeptidase isoform X2 [Orussus abietinus]|uniref:lysosomal Pro-X carboxypeptidase isoform X2 n=1 Tax=Orussus abietinus TaxID=222816 RepID=UPI000626D7A7|nr:lysosomal Pro-X carboxypeptidase isoform X2 [Orussus abietinus]